MLKFSQAEIEGQLDDCFPYGAVKDVAILTNKHPSQLAQELNPNDERKSDAYRFLQTQCALDEACPEFGERHWRQVEQYRELSRPRSAKGLCVHTELGKGVKEDTDIVIANVEGKSLYEQLTEALESKAQKERLIEALIEAINQEKESTNGSNRRYARVA